MTMEKTELLEYACQKFQDKKYDEALEVFVLAYNKGYEQEWVIENIYSCYMTCNEEEFRKSYERQIRNIDVSYDECILDFIPYREGEYYIFDKEEERFRGVFSIYELQDAEPYENLKKMEFSAVALEIEWNWNEVKSILTEARNRKIYAVCDDIKRSVSFLKIPELAEYMENVVIFLNRQEFQNYFHQHTSVYLPMVFYGEEEEKKEFIKIRNQEHQFRISPEGRNTDNVLLTIGIPTHNRGNLLLKRLENLQAMLYDAEIEIAISKNGVHYYQEEYKSVETIQDARINYVGYDKEITMSENWQNVIKIAHGKFVLLVSDEDDVIISALEHYLRLLSSHKNLGMVRSKTVFQYSLIDRSQFFLKGKDAFLGGFLLQNYLSGAIYDRKLFLGADIQYWNKKYENNEFYRLYPHMWWQVLLAFQGDYAVDDTCLIQEGECVLFDEIEKYRADQVEDKELIDEGMDEETGLAFLSTYEGRMIQFEGAVELIKDFQVLDEELKTNALIRLINKTLYLMGMVRDGYHYKVEEFPEWVERLVDTTICVIDELSISALHKKAILEATLNSISTIY